MKAVRAGICLLVAFEVLAFGGVEPWAQAILEMGAAGLLLLWGLQSLRQRRMEIHWNSLYPPLLGLGCIAWAQWAFHFSVYAYATQMELLKYGACFVLFFLAIEAFQTHEEIKTWIWFLISLGFAVSLFGILQSLTSNGKLYWLFALQQGGGPFGPYVNRDHFAGFVELTAPLGLALLFFRAAPRDKSILLGLLTFIPMGAVVLCASRAGLLGLLFEVALLGFLSRKRRRGGTKLWKAAPFVLAAAALVLWLGIGPLVERFHEPASAQVSLEARMWMYRDAWQIFLHHPLAGTGLGTLQMVFPQYESHYPGGIVDHAHNDFLELLADTGILGGLCGLSFIGLLVWQGLANLRRSRSPSGSAICAGALAACAGLLVHSLVDFNLHIPANALIFLLLTGVATAVPPETQRVVTDEPRPPREEPSAAAHERTSPRGRRGHAPRPQGNTLRP